MDNLGKPEKIIYLLISIVPPLVGLINIFINFGSYSYIFESDELDNIKDNNELRPMLNILESNNETIFNDKYFPLFGKYYGLPAAHKYNNCNFMFYGTCKDAIEFDIDEECPFEEVGNKLDYSCVDYPEIPEVNYSYYKNNAFFVEKPSKDDSYKELIKKAVPEKSYCPAGQKKCGYLNNLILCYNIEKDCPINDIVINNEEQYVKNNITYKTIKLYENEFIHFTNKKTDNKIIFDILYSLENPLSSIEIKKENRSLIYKLINTEYQSYYKGDLMNIQAYEKYYDPNINYGTLLKWVNLYDKIKSLNIYKEQYFYYKVFIYKKYPIFISISYETAKKLNYYTHVSWALYYTSNFIQFFSLISVCGLIDKERKKIILYIVLSLIHLFILSCFLVHIFGLGTGLGNDLDEIFIEQNKTRVFYFISFLISLFIGILQNIGFIYLWIKLKNKPNINVNEEFL